MTSLSLQSVRVAADPQRGPGHVVVSVTGSGLTAEQCSLVLQQGSGSALKHLGPNGWQSSEARLQPLAVTPTPTGLALLLGPTTVQHIQQGNYRLHLVLNGGTTEGKGFAWTAPPFRPSQTLLTVPDEETDTGGPHGPGSDGVVFTAAPRPKAEPAAPEPEPEPDAEPEPELPPMPLDAPTREEDPQESPSFVRSTLPWLLAGLVLLLLIGGGLSYWLWGREAPPEEPVVVETQEPQPVPEPEPEPEAEPELEALPALPPLPGLPEPDSAAPPLPPLPNTQDQGESLTLEEKLRRFLATNPTPEAMATWGTELLAEREVGAALLLLRRAGEGGHVDALLAVGRLYDPSPGGLRVQGGPAPNGRIAITQYRQARDLGSTEATEALTRLTTWAEDEAARGNSEAQTLLTLLRLE